MTNTPLLKTVMIQDEFITLRHLPVFNQQLSPCMMIFQERPTDALP